jgi:hypothetical protein
VFWAVYVHILFFSFKNMLPSHKEGGGGFGAEEVLMRGSRLN